MPGDIAKRVVIADNDGEWLELIRTDLELEGHIVVAAPRLTIEEAMGVNTPQQLAEVEQVLRQRSQTPDGVASC